MHKELAELMKHIDHPIPGIEMLRHSLKESVERKANPDQPALLSGDSLKYFDTYKDCLPEFLATENGVDAIYLLEDAFKAYVAEKRASADPEVTEE